MIDQPWRSDIGQVECKILMSTDVKSVTDIIIQCIKNLYWASITLRVFLMKRRMKKIQLWIYQTTHSVGHHIMMSHYPVNLLTCGSIYSPLAALLFLVCSITRGLNQSEKENW